MKLIINFTFDIHRCIRVIFGAIWLKEIHISDIKNVGKGTPQGLKQCNDRER